MKLLTPKQWLAWLLFLAALAITICVAYHFA